MSTGDGTAALESPNGAGRRRHWYERRWVQFAVSLLLIAALWSAVDVDRARILESVAQVRWWPIVVALLLRPVAVWARAWQAALILDSAGVGLTVRDVWRAFMFGEMLSRFVPGNLGTLAYVAKLSNRLSEAVIAQLLDRVFFLMLTLLMAALSLLADGRVALALATFAVLLGVVLLGLGLLRGLIRWAPLTAAQRETIDQVLLGRRAWGKRYVLASTLSLALTAGLFGLLVIACRGAIHLFDLVASVCLVTIGAALPVTINGVGIREWVFVVLLNETLPSKEAVVTLAALTYLVGFASALLGVVGWVCLPRTITSQNAES